MSTLSWDRQSFLRCLFIASPHLLPFPYDQTYSHRIVKMNGTDCISDNRLPYHAMPSQGGINRYRHIHIYTLISLSFMHAHTHIYKSV